MNQKKMPFMFCMMLAVIILLTSCSQAKTGDVSEEPSVKSLIPKESEPVKEASVIEQFYQLLQEDANSSQIYSFIEANSEKIDSDEMDTMINALMGYDADIWDIDYKKLLACSKNMSGEMSTFVTFMAEEQASPSLENEKIKVTLDELLVKTRMLENQMIQYPDGLTFSRTYELYCRFLSAAITGMYDNSTNTKSVYLNDRQTKVLESAVESYKTFTSEYPNSNTAKIVSKYLEILAKKNNVFTEDVKSFYEKLYAIIRAQFHLKER